jgi:tetratricopeptide (TPR) repeat protein
MPLTSIRILANGDRAVAWDGKTSWQPDSGQFLLDFEAGDIAEHAGLNEDDEAESEFAAVASNEGSSVGLRVLSEERVRAAQAARTTAQSVSATTDAEPPNMSENHSLTAEQWFHLGCELETESPVEARQAYVQAVAAAPDFGDAHLNLGRLLHESGELGKAEAHYRDAVRCAPDDAICHFNLAVLYEDRGRPDEAILAYQRAIACDAEAADSHYNLGLLLEAKGRRAEAMKHLMIARQLYAQSHRDS